MACRKAYMWGGVIPHISSHGITIIAREKDALTDLFHSYFQDDREEDHKTNRPWTEA